MDRRIFISNVGIGAAGSFMLPRFAHASPTIRDDITLVGEILTKLHPGLYRYISPRYFDMSLARLRRQWTAQPDIAQRYLNLSRFLATIKCGHSYANFFNQKKPVQQLLFDRGTRLPFSFKWIGSQMVVLADHSGTGSLPRGAVVKSINGIPAKDILTTLLPYVRADGSNDAKRRALLSVTGADEFETFDVFHGLHYGAPRDGKHRLRLRTSGSKEDKVVELSALSLSQRQIFMQNADYRSDNPVWSWTVRDDGIAVLTMDSWGLYNSKWDWETWLNERLDSLGNAKGLIIDIRENEGGNDCGDVILARLTGKDIIKPTSNRLVRYDKVPANLNPILDTWDDSFRNWGDQVERVNSRYFGLKRWDDGGVLAAKGPRINSPVAVLIGPQNSSATFQFASLCKQLGLATLIGETTGGNQRGINGGAFFFARLPDSGIEFDVPLVGFFPEGGPPDAGIQPDVTVEMTVSAIADGRDPQMDAAVRHILS
jgi:Peptidase family S41